MDLPNLFTSGAKLKTEELVLFITLSDVKVQALLLELSRNGVQIIDKSEEFEFESLDKCVEKTDLALQRLNKESEKVNETVFALHTSWVKNGEVIDEKKPFIKKLSDDLNLKALGFIDINESLAQQQVDENALFSGILLVFTKSELLFTLIHQGKINSTESVGSSASFDSDFEEGIARLQKNVQKKGIYLPPKLVLASFELSDAELHEFQQKIYDRNWEENSIFLQTPTVQMLSHDQFLLGLSKEAGKNAAAHKGLTDFALAAAVSHSQPEAQVYNQGEVKSLDSSEFGFEDPLQNEAKSTATSFGIPIDLNDLETAVDDQDDNLTAIEDNFTKKGQKGIVFDKKKKIDWSHRKYTKWYVGLGIGLGLLFLVTGIIFGSSLFATTEVSITPNKKLVSKDIEITLDTNASETDVEKLLIAADTITKKAAGESSIATTGIKIVGENAKGLVAVYNKTDGTKTFGAGTQLNFGDLVFSLDNDITIASASGSQGGTDYGKVETTVTASQIGAESNLKKDSELSIASFATSSYNAFVIQEDFTGGSSREVRVVAQKDLDEILNDLRDELLEQVNEEFKNESGNGTYILPSKSIIDETAEYSSQVEDESESVTLNLEIEVEALTYKGGDLKPVAQEILSKDLPENYELEDADPQILSSPSQTDLDALEAESVVSIDANISAFAVPILSEDEIKQIVAGKPFSQAEQELTSKEEISAASFKVIPGLLGSFVKKVSSSLDKIKIIFNK